MKAVLIDSLNGGGSNFKMGRKPKVVQRCKVHACPFLPRLIDHGGLGTCAGLKLGCEGPYAMLHTISSPLEIVLGARIQILTSELDVVGKTAFQRTTLDQLAQVTIELVVEGTQDASFRRLGESKVCQGLFHRFKELFDPLL